MQLTIQNYFNELLQLNSRYGKLVGADGTFQDTMRRTQIEAIKKLHLYSISPPTSEKGRWQTRYKDENGKSQIVKAATEEKLFEKLAMLYFSAIELEKLSFHDLFISWLDYKKELTSSGNTILRHKQHYRKYFESSKLHTIKLKHLDSLLLEKECNRIIKEFSLSRKEWCNVKTILNGMFDFAVRKKYISLNPMNDVRIVAKYRQVIKKSGKTQTFNPEELANINRYLDEKYSETGDVAFLAVRVNFFLGLRVGELVALKWEDFEDNYLHVVREEVRDQETRHIYVVNHTKTHTDRHVIIPEKAIKLFETISRQGEYVFMRNGERVTSNVISYILNKYAKQQGLVKKSSHKIRKTYASLLAAAGVPFDAIREQLGHKELPTTLGYFYNPFSEKETYRLINQAL